MKETFVLLKPSRQTNVACLYHRPLLHPTSDTLNATPYTRQPTPNALQAPTSSARRHASYTLLRAPSTKLMLLREAADGHEAKGCEDYYYAFCGAGAKDANTLAASRTGDILHLPEEQQSRHLKAAGRAVRYTPQTLIDQVRGER